jgi:TctA family transporter
MICAANNLCIGGAMTTMLSLGISRDSVTAILLGAFYINPVCPVSVWDHPAQGINFTTLAKDKINQYADLTV